MQHYHILLSVPFKWLPNAKIILQFKIRTLRSHNVYILQLDKIYISQLVLQVLFLNKLY